MNMQGDRKVAPTGAVGGYAHGEQEPHKKAAAQEMLQRAQASVTTGDVGSTKEVSEALNRVQDVLESKAKTAPDSTSEKTISDLAKLVQTAEQVVVEKDIGDRLKRISKEAELAAKELPPGVTSMDVTGLTTKAQEKSRQYTQQMSTNFGPFFRLITTSEEFRRLILDFIKISRKVLLRSFKDEEGDGYSSHIENQWLKGRDPAEIARDVSSRAMSSAKNEQGQIEIVITQEELETLQQNLLEMFSVIARDDRYREGITQLFNMSEMITEEGDYSAENLKQQVRETANQPHMQKLQQETKDLVAEFTGTASLERFLGSLRTLARSIRNDEQASQYMRDVKSFILDTRDPQHVQSEQFKQRSRELAERGRALADKMKNKAEVEEFFNAGDNLLNSLRDDELLNQLYQRAGMLVEDLTYEDTNGVRQIDTTTLGNIRNVIVPVLADAFKYIPIPRIEDSDSKREYMIDNVVLCGYDVIPDKIGLHLESDTSLNVRDIQTDKTRTRLVVSLRNLRTEIKDVKFYFKRKEFPKVADSGLATIRIGGKGAELKITFDVEQKAGERAAIFTSSGKVDFNIGTMDIDVNKDTINHDILIPMVIGLFKRNIISAIERGVEKNLTNVINDVGLKLSEALLRQSETGFTRQLEQMTQSVKKGEFGRRFEQRQRMLEQKS